MVTGFDGNSRRTTAGAVRGLREAQPWKIDDVMEAIEPVARKRAKTE
jgi:hypothetical protein